MFLFSRKSSASMLNFYFFMIFNARKTSSNIFPNITSKISSNFLSKSINRVNN